MYVKLDFDFPHFSPFNVMSNWKKMKINWKLSN